MKSREREVRASTSVYFALVMLLVVSLLFTLLEGARIEGLKAAVKMNSEVEAESMLAGYVSPLWEKYHIFGADRANIEAVDSKASTRQGLWLFALQTEGVSMDECHLLTDDKGEGFCRLAAEYMKYHMPAATVEAAKTKLQQMQDAKDKAGDMDAKAENADSCIQKAKEEEQEAQSGQDTAAAPVVSETTVENPLEYRKGWKKADCLALLGVDTSRLSEKKADLSKSVTRRKRQTGNWSGTKTAASAAEQLLFQQYLLEQFACYPANGENTAASGQTLDYEIEYLLAGKASDRQNLKTVLKQILALREVANFVYLQTDSQKKGEALTLATLLVGASGNTLLIKGVQQGILAVWAFAESISDTRSLLAGKTIPIIKTAEQWTTDVGGLSKDSSFSEASQCTGGLTYKDYLCLLLAMENRGKLCYRAMDLMEWEIRTVKGYENLQMDMLWDQAVFTYEYQAKPLFVSTIRKSYCWSIQQTVQYVKD